MFRERNNPFEPMRSVFSGVHGMGTGYIHL